MQKNEKLDKIKDLLSTEYDGDMSGREINAFAADLYLSVFECEFELAEIISIVNKYEADANIENTRWYYVFCGIVELLDSGNETAERLYNCFMGSWDILELFLKLYLENGEYISDEKLNNAKKKALRTFEKEILKHYGVME